MGAPAFGLDLERFIELAIRKQRASKATCAHISHYIDDGPIVAYMRQQNVYIGEKPYPTLIIATVEAIRQRQGHFTRFLEKCHRRNVWAFTGVECVNNDDLYRFLIREGFFSRDPVEDPRGLLLKPVSEPIYKTFRLVAGKREYPERLQSAVNLIQ